MSRHRRLTTVMSLALLASCGIAVAFFTHPGKSSAQPSPDVVQSLNPDLLTARGIEMQPATATNGTITRAAAEKVARENGGAHPTDAQLVQVRLNSSLPGPGESRVNPAAIPDVGGPVWAVLVSDAPPVSGRPGQPLRNVRDTYWVFFIDARTGEFIMSQGGAKVD